MMKKNYSSFAVICTVVLSLCIFGCGSDDSDDSSGNEGASGSGGGASGDNGGSGSGTFTGVLLDQLNRQPVEGVQMKALDNETLDPLGPTATTAADGTFKFEGLTVDQICVLAVGSTELIDTYTYNVGSDEQDRMIITVPVGIAELIDGMVPGENDPTTGGASGAVYYRDEAGTELGVGCATVEVVGVENATVYYFKDNLPDVGEERSMQTGNDGLFYAVDLPPGTVTLNALVNGEVIGSTSLKVTAPENSTGGLYNSNITRIYAEKTGNPCN